MSSIRNLAAGNRWLRALGMASAVVLSFCMIATAAEARSKHHNSVSHFTPKSASLVMDANTGRILYSRNADEQCYPASLTKVMTLYLLFEQLHAGKITLDTRMPVSYHAASQAPSRLGLKPGETIDVRDAILALVTKSANDVAVTVAEYLGGTEKQFAARMTQKARALGMSHTQYMNASGLPNKGQLITARDMATLAKHIQVDFPQYYHYFSTEEFAWDGKLIRNHNHLLGKYEGVNGLKTGYTAASGFNLTTSVWRDGKSVIGVVLGGKTARARDVEMVSILDRTMPSAIAMRDTGNRFASAEPAPTPLGKPLGISDDDRNALAALASNDDPDPDEETYTGTEKVASLSAQPPSVAMAPIADDDAPTPVAKPAPIATPEKPKPVVTAAVVPVAAPLAPATPVAAPVRVASAAPDINPAPGMLGILPAQQTAVAETETTAAAPAPRAAAPLDHATAYALAALSRAEGPVRNVGRDIGNLIVTPAQASEGLQSTTGLRTAVNQSTQVPQRDWRAGDPLIPEGSWVIQIGAYADQADAVDRIRDAIKAAPKELGNAVPVTVPVKTADNRMLYRSRFGGFDGEKEARNACGRLARESISCIAIPPANWSLPQSAVAKEKERG